MADPLAPDSNDALAMTHWPPQPAQPYMHPNVPVAAKKISDFASGGLQKAMGLPENAMTRALQSPTANMVMGMVGPLKGTGEFLEALRGVGQDRPLFNQIVEQLKGLPMKDLNEIAKQYALYPGNYKTKGDALNDIVKMFIRNARFENKLK